MINGRRVAALCISRLGDNTCFDLVSSLQKTLVEHDCSLFIYNINSDLYNKEDETAEVYVYELIDYSVIDAIIIDPEKIKSSEKVEQIIDKAHENNVPVIIVEGVIEGLINVNFDFRGGFEKVVRHVVEFHRKNKILSDKSFLNKCLTYELFMLNFVYKRNKREYYVRHQID